LAVGHNNVHITVVAEFATISTKPVMKIKRINPFTCH